MNEFLIKLVANGGPGSGNFNPGQGQGKGKPSAGGSKIGEASKSNKVKESVAKVENEIKKATGLDFKVSIDKNGMPDIKQQNIKEQILKGNSNILPAKTKSRGEIEYAVVYSNPYDDNRGRRTSSSMPVEINYAYEKDSGGSYIHIGTIYIDKDGNPTNFKRSDSRFID